jgi:hypothetical protein
MSASSRYNAATMSCSEIQSRIHAEGSVVLRDLSNPAMPRHERYVDSMHFCSRDEVLNRTSIPASDTRSCAVKACTNAR